jgi:XTP/dITP diphosphohydrolase
MRELVIATSNPGKIKDFEKILGPEFFSYLSLKDIGFFDEIIEDGDSFKANALIKARAIYQFSHKATLADDSGICVDALQGAPGIFSARFAGTHGDNEANNLKLASLMQTEKNKQAHYFCALAFINEHGEEFIFNGKIEGQIVLPPRGKGGFGYDAYFQPEGLASTFAEMEIVDKKNISHRGRAIHAFQEFISGK